jgi:hypothetical protein
MGKRRSSERMRKGRAVERDVSEFREERRGERTVVTQI